MNAPEWIDSNKDESCTGYGHSGGDGFGVGSGHRAGAGNDDCVGCSGSI